MSLERTHWHALTLTYYGGSQAPHWAPEGLLTGTRRLTRRLNADARGRVKVAPHQRGSSIRSGK